MRSITPAVLPLAALAAFATGPTVALADEPKLEITDAWARPTIPTRPGAGYFTLVNTGDEADVLLAASSEGAERVEMHMVNEQLGVAEMLMLESIEISPGEEVVFEPGGMHLMFVGLDEPLAEGDEFTATLEFEKAGEVEVEFTVGEDPPGSAGEDGGDGNSG